MSNALRDHLRQAETHLAAVNSELSSNPDVAGDESLESAVYDVSLAAERCYSLHRLRFLEDGRTGALRRAFDVLHRRGFTAELEFIGEPLVGFGGVGAGLGWVVVDSHQAEELLGGSTFEIDGSREALRACRIACREEGLDVTAENGRLLVGTREPVLRVAEGEKW